MNLLKKCIAIICGVLILLYPSFAINQTFTKKDQQIIKQQIQQKNQLKLQNKVNNQKVQNNNNNTMLNIHPALRQYFRLKGILASRGSVRRYAVKEINVEISAYTPYDAGCNFITASGQRVRYGIVAAPKQLKFGTELIIPEFNIVFVVADRGGYIKKVNNIYRIDIFVWSKSEAKKIGRKRTKAYIIYQR